MTSANRKLPFIQFLPFFYLLFSDFSAKRDKESILLKSAVKLHKFLPCGIALLVTALSAIS
jgi:hypothetical protein